MLSFFVTIGSWGTIQKEKNNEKNADKQADTIQSLKDQFLTEIKGEGFPIVKGYIVDQHEILLSLENKKKLPVYSLNIGLSDAFDLQQDFKDYPDVMSHGAPVKNIPVLSIAPNISYLFYDKKVGSINETELYYYVTVSWRDDGYHCTILFNINNDLSVMIPKITYTYHNKEYSSEVFEETFCTSKK